MASDWQTESEFYEQLGRFCVEFELFCRSMENCIRVILQSEGLNNLRVQEVLLSGYTAEPLRSLMQNLVGEVLVKTEPERKLSTKIFTTFQELISERNNLLHGKWSLMLSKAEGDQTELHAFGVKLHANKKGAAVKELNIRKSELEQLIYRCKEASVSVSLITRCVLGIRTLTQCFRLQENRLVVKHYALKPIIVRLRDD